MFIFNDPNYLLKGDGFYISYNPKTGLGNPFAELASTLTGNENGLAETALKGIDGTWYILNGDFRAEYLEAFPGGFEACLAVYKRNISHRSNWSTDSISESAVQ